MFTKLSYCPLLILALSAFVIGQTVSAEKWTRIELEKGELSITVPPGFLVDADAHRNLADMGNFQYLRIFAASHGLTIDLMLNRQYDGKRSIQRIQPKEGEQIQDFTIDKIEGKEMTVSDPTKRYSKRIFITVGTRFYTLKLEAPSVNNNELTRFLYCMLLNGKPMFKRAGIRVFQEEAISGASLSTSPEIRNALFRKTEGQTTNMELRDASAFVAPPEPPETVTPIMIVDRPNPKNPGLSAENWMSAKLVITYQANGQIGNITVYTDSGKRFARICVDAARKTKFVPARDGDKYVDYVGVWDYSFLIMHAPNPRAFPPVR